MPDSTRPTSPSLSDRRLVERVALALAVHRGQRWVYDGYLDATSRGLTPSTSALSLMAEARAVLEIAGEPIVLLGMSLAQDGWVPLGTHVDMPDVEIEFHPDLDDAGMPMWERPLAARSTDQRPAGQS